MIPGIKGERSRRHGPRLSFCFMQREVCVEVRVDDHMVDISGLPDCDSVLC
jgi:hypothetical protein